MNRVAGSEEARTRGLFSDTWIKCGNTKAFFQFLARAQLFSTQRLPSSTPALPHFPLHSPLLIARSQIKCHVLREHILGWRLLRQPPLTALNSAYCNIFTCVLICLTPVLPDYEFLRVGTDLYSSFLYALHYTE